MKKCLNCDTIYENELEVCPTCMAPLTETEETATLADETVAPVSVEDAESKAVEYLEEETIDETEVTPVEESKKPKHTIIVACIAVLLALVLAFGTFFIYTNKYKPENVALDGYQCILDGDYNGLLPLISPAIKKEFTASMKEQYEGKDPAAELKTLTKQQKAEQGIKKEELSVIKSVKSEKLELDNYNAYLKNKGDKTATKASSVFVEVTKNIDSKDPTTGATTKTIERTVQVITVIMIEGKWYLLF